MNKPTKASKDHSSDSAVTPLENLRSEVQTLKSRLDRVNVKTSKVAESFIGYFEQYNEYDCFLTAPEPSNPWISDSTEMWETEKQNKVNNLL